LGNEWGSVPHPLCHCHYRPDMFYHSILFCYIFQFQCVVYVSWCGVGLCSCVIVCFLGYPDRVHGWGMFWISGSSWVCFQLGCFLCQDIILFLTPDSVIPLHIFKNARYSLAPWYCGIKLFVSEWREYFETWEPDCFNPFHTGCSLYLIGLVIKTRTTD
jgi:hypothetical protein